MFVISDRLMCGEMYTRNIIVIQQVEDASVVIDHWSMTDGK